MAENVCAGKDIHIKPNCIIITDSYAYPPQRGGNTSEKSLENLQNNRVKGKLSETSRRKLINSVNWMSAAAKKFRVWSKERKRHFEVKLAFITLTLPSTDHSITDHQFKTHLLAKFIDWMKKTQGVKNYVWKVEAQANGNIHAHLIVNQFIHHTRVRRHWNKLLKEEGVHRSYEEKHGKSQAPTTEIKSVVKQKQVAKYIASYLSKKEEGKRAITGRLWACNYHLSSKNNLKVCAWTYDTDELLNWWCHPEIVRKYVKVKSKLIGAERIVAELAILDRSKWEKIVHPKLRDYFKAHLFEIRAQVPVMPAFHYQL